MTFPMQWAVPARLCFLSERVTHSDPDSSHSVVNRTILFEMDWIVSLLELGLV